MTYQHTNLLTYRNTAVPNVAVSTETLWNDLFMVLRYLSIMVLFLMKLSIILITSPGEELLPSGQYAT